MCDYICNVLAAVYLLLYSAAATGRCCHQVEAGQATVAGPPPSHRIHSESPAIDMDMSDLLTAASPACSSSTNLISRSSSASELAPRPAAAFSWRTSSIRVRSCALASTPSTSTGVPRRDLGRATPEALPGGAPAPGFCGAAAGLEGSGLRELMERSRMEPPGAGPPRDGGPPGKMRRLSPASEASRSTESPLSRSCCSCGLAA
mmetsp:Transcript_14886/g.38199  ORF Transcript_14886/g.38199 Transcript_14886/m.38199 type:complete len:204 (-) Transcript_14886:1550-2161(-)